VQCHLRHMGQCTCLHLQSSVLHNHLLFIHGVVLKRAGKPTMGRGVTSPCSRTNDGGDAEGDEDQDEADEAEAAWKQRQLRCSWAYPRPSRSHDKQAGGSQPTNGFLSRRSGLGLPTAYQDAKRASLCEGSSRKLEPSKSCHEDYRGKLVDKASQQQQMSADPGAWCHLGSSSCTKHQQQQAQVQQPQHGWLSAGRCVLDGAQGNHSPLLGGRARRREKEGLASPGRLLVSPPVRQRSKRTGLGGSAWQRCAGLGSAEDLNDEEAAGERQH
jgi:hypothetical protein